MRWLVVLALLTPLLLGGCVSGFHPGVVANGIDSNPQAAQSVHAPVVRTEFGIGTPATGLDAAVGAFASRGVRVLPLAGFEGRTPTVAEAQNLASWAQRFGPGGSFWVGRPALPINSIEVGNETSYGYQYGNDGPTNQSYLDRAQNYAHRVVTARKALNAVGRADVGLLAQADNGGSGSSAWVDNMFIAEPGLAASVDGWTVHPYGPRFRWEDKVDRLVAQVGAHGGGLIPIDVTEYGITTDNGRTLTGNSDGWPVNLTYADAGVDLLSTVGQMRAKYGSRLRYFIIYGSRDGRATGTTTNRESYFGALQDTLAEKGNYSAAVRGVMGQGG